VCEREKERESVGVYMCVHNERRVDCCHQMRIVLIYSVGFQTEMLVENGAALDVETARGTALVAACRYISLLALAVLQTCHAGDVVGSSSVTNARGVVLSVWSPSLRSMTTRSPQLVARS
jgi:hypothetical protein